VKEIFGISGNTEAQLASEGQKIGTLNIKKLK
jgi:hypothetical protein